MHDGEFNGGCGIGIIKGKKYIVIFQLSSAFYSDYTVYKMKGTSLKKVAKYGCHGYADEKVVEYVKNNRRITENKYLSFVRSIVNVYGNEIL